MTVKILSNYQGSNENNHPSYIETTNITMPEKEGFSLHSVVKFVKRIRQFDSVIRIRKKGVLADGKDIMEILCLETAWKTKLYFECEGIDAKHAVKCINTFFFNTRNIN